MPILDRFLPRPRLRQVDRVAVAEEAWEAWPVVRAVDLDRIPLVRRLLAARTLPEHLHAWLHGRRAAPAPHGVRLDDIIAPGGSFHLLAEEPGRAIAAGAVGKPWEPRAPFLDVDDASFEGFDEPGYAKIAWSLEVEPRIGGGAWVGVDVRAGATDEAAWRRFRRYWTVVGPFSRAVRRLLLRDLVHRLGRPPPEGARPLPGDDVLRGAPVSWTQAVTIEAKPAHVFPWLPSRTGGLALLRAEPERLVVLGSPQPGAPHFRMTWAFVLDPIGDGATRLVARVRASPHPGPGGMIARAALRPVHALMEHEQLRTIKAHAEARQA